MKLIAKKYKRKNMLAPMYFWGDRKYKRLLKRKGYSDIKEYREKRK